MPSEGWVRRGSCLPSRSVSSPRKSAKWSERAMPIITFSFYGNNAKVTRRLPEGHRAWKNNARRWFAADNAGESGKNSRIILLRAAREVYLYIYIRGRLWSNSIILPSVSRISPCVCGTRPTFIPGEKKGKIYPYLRYNISKFIHALPLF